MVFILSRQRHLASQRLREKGEEKSSERLARLSVSTKQQARPTHHRCACREKRRRFWDIRKRKDADKEIASAHDATMCDRHQDCANTYRWHVLAVRSSAVHVRLAFAALLCAQPAQRQEKTKASDCKNFPRGGEPSREQRTHARGGQAIVRRSFYSEDGSGAFRTADYRCFQANASGAADARWQDL